MARLIFTHETCFKTVTYCFMHFTVAIAVAYALTGSWAIALSIGTMEPLVQTVFFNLHERGWKTARTTYESRLGVSPL